jgi:hypothetical protein
MDRARRLSRFSVIATTVISCQYFFSSGVVAAGFMNQFIDKEDGWVDGSDWVLNNAVGFLPVPIIITEPAVGEGLGLAAAFFHPPDDYDPDAEGPSLGRDADTMDDADFVLPDISVAAAAITNNSTWFVGGGHIAHWKDDHIRFEGIAGYASINVKFYGLAEGPQIDRGVEFNAEGAFFDVPIAFRIGESKFFVGGGYNYVSVDTSTDLGNILPPEWQGPDFGRLNLDTNLSALEAFVQYDSRDNVFTPNTGFDGEISIARNDEAIGSDWDYTQIKVVGHKYWLLGEKFVLGLRGDYNTVSGEVPFFAVPFISLRGIPALRYQGESVIVGETELRWAFHPRISAVGFLGAGRTAHSFSDLNDATTRVTQGVGIRYFAARKLGMHGGIDVAKGPDDTYWYLTFGSAW